MRRSMSQPDKIAVSEDGQADGLDRIAKRHRLQAGAGPHSAEPVVAAPALMRRDDPLVEFILAALEGHPVRDGAELIGEIAQCRELTAEVRSQAIRAMSTVVDKAVVAQAVAMFETEPCREVANALLDLAVQRGLAVPMKRLQQRIEKCQERVERHRLLKGFVQVMPHGTTAEWEIATGFLHSLIQKALRSDGDEDANELAKALTMALPCAGSLDRRCIREDTFNLARHCLAQFARAPEQVPEGCVLLSVAVVDRFHDADARVDLREALDAALNLVERPGSQDKRRERIASAIANCLVRSRPANCWVILLTVGRCNGTAISRLGTRVDGICGPHYGCGRLPGSNCK